VNVQMDDKDLRKGEMNSRDPIALLLGVAIEWGFRDNRTTVATLRRICVRSKNREVGKTPRQSEGGGRESGV